MRRRVRRGRVVVAPLPSAFSPRERRVVDALRSPARAQAWLSSLPYNREPDGPTARSFRGVVAMGTAHCFEAAVSAAAVLEQHGFPPLLLDIESWDALDHVLFLFREDGRWGTVAKSRDPGLHGRRPEFRTLRDLVRSYQDPYVDLDGRITGFGVLDLRELPRGDWRLARRNLRYVEEALRELPHRAFRMPEARFRRFRAEYRAFKSRYPGRKPVRMYSGRDAWWGWPPPRRFRLS